MSVVLCCWIWCWFRIPSSMLMASSYDWRGSTVCLRNSLWISGSIKLVTNTSRIRVSSLFLKLQFSADFFSYHRNVRQFHLKVVLILERCGDRKWDFEGEWMRLPQSSKILQRTMYRSVHAGFYSSEPDFFPPRCSSREVRLFFDPHIMPISISRWHLFCQFIFFWALRAFLSFSDCADEPIIVSSYMGSNGSSTISSFGPSKVLRIIFSFASSANLYCTLHLSQRIGGSGVRLSQIASIPSGAGLFAGCAMSYTIWILQSLAMRVSLLLSKLWFAEQDPNLICFRLLAVRDTNREEQLNLNWETESISLSACNQLKKVWSDKKMNQERMKLNNFRQGMNEHEMLIKGK